MYLTLNQYHVLARRILRRRAPDLMYNEDAIAMVSTYAMKADERFDGRGSRDGFRVKSADYGARSFLLKYTKNKENADLSLDFKTSEDSSFGDNFGSSKEDPAVCLERSELVDKIINSPLLTDIQRAYIRKHYLDSMTIDEISKEYNVTKQAVHYSIGLGLNKLRREFNNE